MFFYVISQNLPLANHFNHRSSLALLRYPLCLRFAINVLRYQPNYSLVVCFRCDRFAPIVDASGSWSVALSSAPPPLWKRCHQLVPRRQLPACQVSLDPAGRPTVLRAFPLGIRIAYMSCRNRSSCRLLQ